MQRNIYYLCYNSTFYLLTFFARTRFKIPTLVFTLSVILIGTGYMCQSAVSSKQAERSFSILEYKFPWPPYDMKPPWRSAMAQGEALPILVKAFEATNDSKYLNTAESLLNSFYVEVTDGGITYKSPHDGWWYELYAGDNASRPRVLNGMMFTLIGLYEYYNHTGSPSAKYLFDQGMLGLSNNIKNYDRNGSSYYDSLGYPSKLDYHVYHIRLLSELYSISREPVLKIFYDRWRSSDLSNLTIQPPANIWLDDSYVPFVDYGTLDGLFIGEQRNPVTVNHIATKYYERFENYGDRNALTAFLNNADWIVENAVQHVTQAD